MPGLPRILRPSQSTPETMKDNQLTTLHKVTKLQRPMLINGLIDIFTHPDKEYGNVNLVQDILRGNRETIKNETHISGLKKPAQKK